MSEGAGGGSADAVKWLWGGGDGSGGGDVTFWNVSLTQEADHGFVL